MLECNQIYLLEFNLIFQMSYYQNVTKASKLFGRCHVRPQDQYPELRDYRLQLNQLSVFHLERPDFLIFSWTPSSEQLESKIVSKTETPKFIDSLGELEQAANEISRHYQIAVDLEATDIEVYYSMTCVIQVSTPDQNYVIDALKLFPHIKSTLGRIFENPQILKVFHGTNDLQWLQRDFKIFPLAVLDMQEIYDLIQPGSYPISFKRMVDHALKRSIDKLGQFADWRKRPLHPDLLKYAVKDTRLLFRCWEWAKLECSSKGINLQCQVLPRTIEATYKIYEFPRPPTPAKEFTGNNEAERLNFHKVFAIRDKIARLVDRKPSDVISSAKLNELSKIRLDEDLGITSYFKSKQHARLYSYLFVADNTQSEVRSKRNKFRFCDSPDEDSDEEFPIQSNAQSEVVLSDISDSEMEIADPDVPFSISITVDNDVVTPKVSSTSSSQVGNPTSKDQSTQTISWHYLRRQARKANKHRRNIRRIQLGLPPIPFRRHPRIHR